MFASVYGITCIRVKPKVLEAQNLINHSDIGIMSLQATVGCTKQANHCWIQYLIFSTMRLRAQEESESKNVSVYVTPLPFSASGIPENVTC